MHEFVMIFWSNQFCRLQFLLLVNKTCHVHFRKTALSRWFLCVRLVCSADKLIMTLLMSFGQFKPDDAECSRHCGKNLWLKWYFKCVNKLLQSTLTDRIYYWKDILNDCNISVTSARTTNYVTINYFFCCFLIPLTWHGYSKLPVPDLPPSYLVTLADLVLALPFTSQLEHMTLVRFKCFL